MTRASPLDDVGSARLRSEVDVTAVTTYGSSLRGNLRMAMTPLLALWRGDLSLGQAFWEYALAYGTIANVVATAAAIAAVVAGLPDAVGVGLFLLPVPYILTAVVGVWRSAQRYDGPPKLAFLAKVAVILWGAIMIFI